MRNTKVQVPIVNLLKAEPKLNFAQIANKTNIKPETVKSVLNRLYKYQRIDRERVPSADKPKAGPNNLYVYWVKPVELDNANTQNG